MKPENLMDGVNKSTMSTGQRKLKVITNKEHTKQRIQNQEGTKGLVVYFTKPHQLTIFEAELLFDLIVLRMKPRDYASYHKCKAGERFIENIKKISKLKSVLIETDEE